jgi:hypothetical protein
MIPAMTEPTRKTATVTINGREVTVYELTDAQMLHLTRHGQILDSPAASQDLKKEATLRTAKILDSLITEGDREYVVDQQEIGELTLLSTVKLVLEAFGPKKAPTKVTRGRVKRTAS